MNALCLKDQLHFPKLVHLENKNGEQMDTMGESHFSVLPLPLSFARSRESKCFPNSGFDRGVGLSGKG